MGINPGNLASFAPPQEDDLSRRVKDLERLVREMASARSAAATQIGSGGLLVNGGGSITIAGTGSLNVGSGALNSAGSITAGTTITAGGAIAGASLGVTGNISANGTILGGIVNSSGDMNANNVRLGSAGTLYSSYAYSNPVVTSYLAAYINGPDGRFGATPSAKRFKQDIAPKVYTVAEAVKLSALVVNYRLIAAVQELGDKAAVEVGVIAESMINAGFPEFVAFDTEGNTLSVHYERICLVIIGAFGELVTRLETMEAKP